MRRTVVERGNEASARALKATSGMLDKLGDAREAYEAVKRDYWAQYADAYENALSNTENEDERD